VPMAALLDEGGQYLAQRFQISYLTSGRDLLRLSEAPVPSSNALVVADPEYGARAALASAELTSTPVRERSAELDRGGLTFRSLPGTAREGQAISTLLRGEGARVLTGMQATEANLKRVHGPRILHLATHGFFLKDQQPAIALGGFGSARIAGATNDASVVIENPLLRSGLALAGANQRRSGMGEDGILTALEMARLDLRGTELVVLSACETGIGDARNGAGITGLRRGLLLAGARTQITSLWKVADEATTDLMVSFYRNLVSGAGRAAALQRAQRSLLARTEYAHPYYWASFVAVGDWRPLDIGPN
jgi:CHAT domain-containing protein